MVAAAVVGSAVVGGVVSSKAASKASKAQTSAANAANATELQIYNQTREDQLPWQEAGNAGLNSLMGLYGFEQQPVAGTGSAAVGSTPAVPPDQQWQMSANPSATSNAFMMKDPGYDFRLKEGQRNIENSAAARGGLMSGNFLKASQKYGQDYASNEFTNIANRYGQLAGVGQATNQSLQSAGQGYANAYGQNVQNAGNARASGYVGQANALTGAINQGVGLYGAYKGGYFG